MASKAHNYEGEPLDLRDLRAATEPMITVRVAPDFWQVHSGSDTVYHVDARDGVCDCDDYFYRAPDDGCKHVKRVRQVTGDQPLPPVDEPDEVLLATRAAHTTD